MRNLVTRYPTIATAIATALLILSVAVTVIIWATENVIEDAKKRTEDRLKMVRTDIIEGARSFTYVYDVNHSVDLGINVADKSVADWEKVHNHTVEQGKLRVKQPENGVSWLDDNFTDGTASTPYLAKTPGQTFKTDPKDAESLAELFKFRLRFAHDHAEGKLYTLGHSVIPTDIGGFVSLKLIVDSNKPKKEIFPVSFEDNGELRDSNNIIRRGTWWKSEQNWFFELALESRPPNGVTLSAVVGKTSEDDGLTGYEVGTRGSLSLSSGHTRDKYRSIFKSLYEVYAMRPGKHWLSVWEGEDGREGAAGIRLTWLLSPLYRLYFYSNSNEIKSCPNASLREDKPEWGAGTCFFNRKGEYLLRRLEKFEERRAGLVGVLTEEPLRAHFGRGPVLAISVIILLVSLTIYAERSRRHAFRELEQANGELDKVNAELERANEDQKKTNEGLRSYVGTFLHEGRRLLRRIPAEVRRVEEGDTGGVARIEELVKEVTQRLWDSTEKFEYERIVREAIENAQKSGTDRFDLSGAVATQVEFFLMGEMEVEVENIEFRTLCGEDHRLFLSAVLSEELRGNPDYYFRQALEKVIVNAAQAIAANCRKPKNSTITILLDVDVENGLPHAVLTVSNEGPPAPKEKLEDMFKLGESYRPGAEEDHQGLGLFLTRQIISAYGGSCRLDNLPDNTGVVVTFRLPVELRAAEPRVHRISIYNPPQEPQ